VLIKPGQVVNDDGPPSCSSPYFRPFITALHCAGHETVVVIPDRPLSWVGKAHAVGKTLTATSRCPNELLDGDVEGVVPAGSMAVKPCDVPHCRKAEDRRHHWLIVDGPPASCTQLGLFHSGFQPSHFDLVISGPNHGRNAGTIYNLSSGTVGGALEAALCRRKAVALSFGSKDPQTDSLIQRAAERAVALIEMLVREWHPTVELYNVNIPMVQDVATCPVTYTKPARTHWNKGSLFAEVPRPRGKEKLSRCHQFRWAPELSDIKAQAEESVEGEDLWASLNGFIGVTPLKANLEIVDVLGG
jgi:5'/3'-nucleotidase SurE